MEECVVVGLIVSRYSSWDEEEFDASCNSNVYGVDLSWSTNNKGLSALIRSRLIHNWESLGIPSVGKRVCATTSLLDTERYPDRLGLFPASPRPHHLKIDVFRSHYQFMCTDGSGGACIYA